jgi:hypothetical protein
MSAIIFSTTTLRARNELVVTHRFGNLSIKRCRSSADVEMAAVVCRNSSISIIMAAP